MKHVSQSNPDCMCKVIPILLIPHELNKQVPDTRTFAKEFIFLKSVVNGSINRLQKQNRNASERKHDRYNYREYAKCFPNIVKGQRAK